MKPGKLNKSKFFEVISSANIVSMTDMQNNN